MIRLKRSITALILAAVMCTAAGCSGADTASQDSASTVQEDTTEEATTEETSADEATTEEASADETSTDEVSTEEAADDSTDSAADASATDAADGIGVGSYDGNVEDELNLNVTTVSASEVSSDDLASLNSREFAALLGNGINLGNTMEATNNDHDSILGNDVTFYETYWGQPVTTQEMIDDMAAAGFTTIRIPVAWTNTMHYEDGDYTIDEAYLARVGEIIDYAYNAGMYVVINDHWDGGWYGLFGSADEAKQEAAMEMYISMWTQIAEYYKDYDLRLVFEGANEEIGDRLNDIDNDFVGEGATLSKDECYAKALEINQTFVDTVRSTGGNNESRFLLIPGYGTDITQTLDARWSMPTDTDANGTDKLLLSVHYYTPWSYCGTGGGATWGTIKNYEEMITLLTNLSVYSEAGYGVIIGECGVMPSSDGTAKPNTTLWYESFFKLCSLYDYCPVVWNTGNIISKETHEVYDADVAACFTSNSVDSVSSDELRSSAISYLQSALEAAPESYSTASLLAGDGNAVAWIMWDSQDWNIVYSVGDTYDPDTTTDGLVATDVEITGEGTYTVALDFTGTYAGYSQSTAFSAIGIANGEELFPGYIITIKEILVNGEEYKAVGRNYTASDDGLCTRTNLYNEWVSEIPDDARTAAGGLIGCSACILDQATLGNVETIEITFDYTPGEEGISTNDANSKN